MTINELIKDIRLLSGVLWKHGLILDEHPPSSKPTGRTHRVGDFSFSDIKNAPTFSLKEYFLLLKKGIYTYLLEDGSIIQLGYEYPRFKDGDPIKHRLLFYPSPIRFHFSLTSGMDMETILFLIDLLEGEVSKAVKEINGMALEEVDISHLNTYAIRFDYDAQVNEDWHPSVHCTLFSQECRWTVSHPLDIATFSELVFLHFWPKYRAKIESDIRRLPKRTFHTPVLPKISGPHIAII